MHLYLAPISFRESRIGTIDPETNRAILRFPGDESLQVQLGQNLLVFPTNPSGSMRKHTSHQREKKKRKIMEPQKCRCFWVGYVSSQEGNWMLENLMMMMMMTMIMMMMMMMIMIMIMIQDKLREHQTDNYTVCAKCSKLSLENLEFSKTSVFSFNTSRYLSYHQLENAPRGRRATLFRSEAKITWDFLAVPTSFPPKNTCNFTHQKWKKKH